MFIIIVKQYIFKLLRSIAIIWKNKFADSELAEISN